MHSTGQTSIQPRSRTHRLVMIWVMQNLLRRNLSVGSAYYNLLRNRRKPAAQTGQLKERGVASLTFRIAGGASGAKLACNRVPVHHVPPCVHIVGAAVLVVQVIGMLPNVQPQ